MGWGRVASRSSEGGGWGGGAAASRQAQPPREGIREKLLPTLRREAKPGEAGGARKAGTRGGERREDEGKSSLNRNG